MANVRRRRVSWTCEDMRAGQVEGEPAIVTGSVNQLLLDAGVRLGCYRRRVPFFAPRYGGDCGQIQSLECLVRPRCCIWRFCLHGTAACQPVASSRTTNAPRHPGKALPGHRPVCAKHGGSSRGRRIRAACHRPLGAEHACAERPGSDPSAPRCQREGAGKCAAGAQHLQQRRQRGGVAKKDSGGLRAKHQLGKVVIAAAVNGRTAGHPLTRQTLEDAGSRPAPG